jgi:hypothetical protein
MIRDFKVTEQRPTKCGSIFCELSITANNGMVRFSYGSMYFACNEDKTITQWFTWMERDQQLKEYLTAQGYKLPF